jgi:hypothetical protein
LAAWLKENDTKLANVDPKAYKELIAAGQVLARGYGRTVGMSSTHSDTAVIIIVAVFLCETAPEPGASGA